MPAMRRALLLAALVAAPAALTAALPVGEYGSGGVLVPDMTPGVRGMTGVLAWDPLPAEETFKIGVRWDEDPVTWSWFWARDLDDTYQRYGATLRYVPFERHGRVHRAVMLVPYWWSTTVVGISTTQFGMTGLYALGTGDTWLAFGLGYQQDDGVSGENTELEPVASLAHRVGEEAWVRAEWRAGGDNFLPRQMAFTAEAAFGDAQVWVGWRTATPPGGSRDDTVFAGVGIAMPWLNP